MQQSLKKTSNNHHKVAVCSQEEDRFKPTVASLAGFLTNLFLATQNIESISYETQMFFMLIFLISLIISIKEYNPSYLFTSMTVVYTPFIIMSSGLSLVSAIALTVTIVVLCFQRGITVELIGQSASLLADQFSQSNIRRKILKLAEKEIDSELLQENDLEEFILVEKQLAKVHKYYKRSNTNVRRALDRTLAQIDNLQKDHAKVLVRSASLTGFLESVNMRQQEAQLKNYIAQYENCDDEVTKSQLSETIKMKENRIKELNNLEVCLKRVKVQKLQMKEMFESLMDKMNTIELSDIITLESSSDAMVKQVSQIRDNLENLEKGMIEIEVSTKKALAI